MTAQTLTPDYARSTDTPKRRFGFGRFMLALLTVDFLALTGWAVWEMGLIGVFEWAVSTPGGILLTTDLLIALGFALTLVWRDARKRGLNPVPYLLVTLGTGSAGPLLYVVRHGLDSDER